MTQKARTNQGPETTPVRPSASQPGGTTEAVARATEYAVSCLPLDHPEAYLFTIKVSWRGRDQWAVMHHGWCFDADGNKDYESIPSERRDDWLERHRFDLDTALALAKRIAPTMTVGPHTVASILAETERPSDA